MQVWKGNLRGFLRMPVEAEDLSMSFVLQNVNVRTCSDFEGTEQDWLHNRKGLYEGKPQNFIVAGDEFYAWFSERSGKQDVGIVTAGLQDGFGEAGERTLKRFYVVSDRLNGIFSWHLFSE